MGELSFHDKKTGVIFGFFYRLLKLWEEFGTNNFAFCWDSRKRFRSAIYPEYKKGVSRTSSITPEERIIISHQMDALRLEILPAFGFRNSFHQTGYEADDLITAIVLNYNDAFIVVSTDKDLFQLLAIAQCQFISNPITKCRMTRELFVSTYSIEPFDWFRAKALMGDPSDNIPGVPGIGEKSAIAFLKGTLTGAKLRAITENQEVIARNWQLVELPFRQPGHPIRLPEYSPNELSLDRLIDIFDHHGFQSFLREEKLSKWKEFVQ